MPRSAKLFSGLFYLGVALTVATLVFVSCEGDQGPAGPAGPSGTNTPRPPVITAVYAVPDSIGTGEHTTLIVSAYDPNGDSLTYQWSAASGTLTSPNAATTRWTPDTIGVFDVSVNVTDQHGTATGSVMVGVNRYVPAEVPSYLGTNAQHCSPCHAPTISTWLNTPHARAFDSSTVSLPQRTTGFDPGIDNGGYDDNPGLHLANVQCEACHGPLGPDVGNHFYLSPAAMTGEACARCHTQWPEYQNSGHGTAMARAGGHEAFNEEWGRESCWSCHIGEGFVKQFDPEWADRGVPHEANQVTCGACHDVHTWSPENPQQLRGLVDFNLPYGGEEFPTGFTVTGWNKGQTCGQCHHSRRDRTYIYNAINNGSQRATPHESPQSDMVAGRGSYEIPTFTYARDNQHSLGTPPFDNVCLGCHMPAEQNPAPHTSHNFHADVRTCQGCHGQPQNFDINGKQTEILALLDQLGQMLPNTQDENGHFIVSIDTRDSTVWSDAMREAQWAWQFVHLDGSLGVHNYNYARSLLVNAIDHLTPGPNLAAPPRDRRLTFLERHGK